LISEREARIRTASRDADGGSTDTVIGVGVADAGAALASDNRRGDSIAVGRDGETCPHAARASVIPSTATNDATMDPIARPPSRRPPDLERFFVIGKPMITNGAADDLDSSGSFVGTSNGPAGRMPASQFELSPPEMSLR
jgi:hypothetical protein